MAIEGRLRICRRIPVQVALMNWYLCDCDLNGWGLYFCNTLGQISGALKHASVFELPAIYAPDLSPNKRSAHCTLVQYRTNGSPTRWWTVYGGCRVIN